MIDIWMPVHGVGQEIISSIWQIIWLHLDSCCLAHTRYCHICWQAIARKHVQIISPVRDRTDKWYFMACVRNKCIMSPMDICAKWKYVWSAWTNHVSCDNKQILLITKVMQCKYVTLQSDLSGTSHVCISKQECISMHVLFLYQTWIFLIRFSSPIPRRRMIWIQRISFTWQKPCS